MKIWQSQANSSHAKKWFLIMRQIIGYSITASAAFTVTFFGLKFFLPPSIQYPLILPAIGLSITALSQFSTFLITTNTNERKLTFFKAIIIGLLQGLAAIPGISRLSITLISARWLGISPHRAFEFSTLLQLATFLGSPARNILNNPTKFLTLYADHLKHISYPEIAIIAGCSIISFYGLRLTWELNQTRSLWKVTPYFAVPLTIIYLIKIHTFSCFA